MKNKTRYSIVIMVFSAMFAAHGAEPEQVGVAERPESVTKGFGGDYFVTVMRSQDKEGDGGIQRIQDGKASDFADGMSEPKGIGFTGKHLVTTDVTKVWKVDAKGKTSVLAAKEDFPHEVRYLNDVAVAADKKSVFVSDMGANQKMFGPQGLWPIGSEQAKEIPMVGRIYEITMDGEVSVAVDPDAAMLNPNGVTVANDGSLLIAEFFKGNILKASEGELTLLASGFRGADGIEQAKGGSIYLSSWTEGDVWKLDANAENETVIRRGFYAAADFYLDEPAEQIVVPDMLANMLFFVPLDD